VSPDAWWEALRVAGRGLLEDVDAVAVGGQQHGMVVSDGVGEVVRPALLWNDTRSADAAAALVAEFGGPQAWAEAVGSVPLAAFTVTKLRWLAEAEPDHLARAQSVQLPHDWLTWQLRGRPADLVTDRGDASGTGYWSPAEGRYRPDLLHRAVGRELEVPRVAAPGEAVGRTDAGALVAPGTGDNMGAALGLGAVVGDVVVSLGTSGTAFAVAEQASADPTGLVAGYADATGSYLPLVCTLNAARVLTATAAMLGTDVAGLSELALQAPTGSGGLVLLPYLDGERTPNLPQATGALLGLTRAAMSPAHLARAAVEGMLCGLADGVDALRSTGVEVHRVLLIGGAARSAAVQRVAAQIFGAPVAVPAPGEYVALGAARQAAWVLSGDAAPPDWPVAVQTVLEPTGDPEIIRAPYAQARDSVFGA
jgi:xylulokinase